MTAFAPLVRRREDGAPLLLTEPTGPVAGSAYEVVAIGAEPNLRARTLEQLFHERVAGHVDAPVGPQPKARRPGALGPEVHGRTRGQVGRRYREAQGGEEERDDQGGHP